MIRRLLPLAAACIALTSPALACNPPVVLIGADGMATWYSPPNDVTADMELRFGERPSDRSNLVIDSRTRTGVWVTEDLSMNDIVVMSGISGNMRFAGPERCRPPMSFDEVPMRRIDPIELFPDEPDAGRQPRSGMWQARLGETTMQGCPAVMQGAFPVSSGALPPEMLNPRRVDFAHPFHPDGLELTKGFQQGMKTRVTWVPAGENGWQTEVFPETFAQIPQGEGGGSKMTWRLTVKSATEIEHAVSIGIELPSIARQVMGASGDCRISAVHSWRRIGD